VESLEENTKIWSDLPPFLGTAIPGSVTKDATNLAGFENPLNRDTFSPAIVVRNYGKGKVMATTVTPFWRWDFLLWGIGKNNQIYQTFSNNSVRWLVVRLEDSLSDSFHNAKLRVYLDKMSTFIGHGAVDLRYFNTLGLGNVTRINIVPISGGLLKK